MTYDYTQCVAIELDKNFITNNTNITDRTFNCLAYLSSNVTMPSPVPNLISG